MVVSVDAERSVAAKFRSRRMSRVGPGHFWKSGFIGINKSRSTLDQFLGVVQEYHQEFIDSHLNLHISYSLSSIVTGDRSCLSASQSSPEPHSNTFVWCNISATLHQHQHCEALRHRHCHDTVPYNDIKPTIEILPSSRTSETPLQYLLTGGHLHHTITTTHCASDL